MVQHTSAEIARVVSLSLLCLLGDIVRIKLILLLFHLLVEYVMELLDQDLGIIRIVHLLDHTTPVELLYLALTALFLQIFHQTLQVFLTFLRMLVPVRSLEQLLN